MSNITQRPSRRVALLGDRPGSYAIARHVRMSAQKVRRVADTVRGMDAGQAIATLRFAPQAAAEPVRKVIESAVANAESSEGLHNEQLVISQIYVDEGVTMRRIRPRAKGSASRILKRASHITAVVEPAESAGHPVARSYAAPAKAVAADAQVAETKAADEKPAKKAAAPKAAAKKPAASKAAADKPVKKPATKAAAGKKSSTTKTTSKATAKDTASDDTKEA